MSAVRCVPVAGLALLAVMPVAPLVAQEAVAAPDGLRRYSLVYTTRIDGDPELVTLDLTSGAATRLTTAPGLDLGGRVSPDGRWLVYSTMRDGNREIFRAALPDGSDPVNLSRDPAEDLLPSWSSDGRQIVFFSTRGQARGPRGEFVGHLYRIDADGGTALRLTLAPLASSFGGELSPDGSHLLFAQEQDGNIDLLEMVLDGSGRTIRVTTAAAAEYGGQYSPEGDRIAFHQGGVGDESHLVVLDRGTGVQSVVTLGHQDYGPSWSPDGEWLVFSRAPTGSNLFGIYAVRLADGLVVPLVVGGVDSRTPSLFRTP